MLNKKLRIPLHPNMIALEWIGFQAFKRPRSEKLFPQKAPSPALKHSSCLEGGTPRHIRVCELLASSVPGSCTFAHARFRFFDRASVSFCRTERNTAFQL